MDKRSILADYFGTNVHGLKEYLQAEVRNPIIMNCQPPWLLMSDETHERLADSGRWLEARIQLDDASRIIQQRWREFSMINQLASMVL